MTFSDYIVYVDESGDHGMERINPYYPMFVLAFCVFKKAEYVSSIVPALQSFKFRYWGHDTVVLHEHEIRKNRGGDYGLLNDPITRSSLMEDLNKIINDAAFHVIATAIDKRTYHAADDPYHLSLEFALEQLKRLFENHNIDMRHQTTHLIFESRGRQENASLELAFRRIMDKSELRDALFVMRFAAKNTNSTGLQLADLIARPIGLHVLRPTQRNRAFDIIRPKLFCKNGSYMGYCLKIYP